MKFTLRVLFMVMFVAIIGLPKISRASRPPASVTDNSTATMQAVPVMVEAGPPNNLLYPQAAIGSKPLQDGGYRGDNITVAIIDSGLAPSARSWISYPFVPSDTLKLIDSDNRFIVYKDLVATTFPITNSSDPYGHGTHVAATIADARIVERANSKEYTLGIAPKVNLVIVRALDENGQAPYSRMVQAINWVVANKDLYNIKVLNLSIQSDMRAPYWFDQVNQAVMAAWASGITVVVAAGNRGPNPFTTTAPGNVPYVITVGALKPGVYTQSGQDELAQYSSAGPTESAFVKPDVIIAGSRVIAPLPNNSYLAQHAGFMRERARLAINNYYMSNNDLSYYALSGTSMATAEVSGVVALMLHKDPSLTNNQVKYRLMATAQLAMSSTGVAAYSIWQQGAGKVMPVNAVFDENSSGSANAGMNITPDRDPFNGVHYMGTTQFISTTNTIIYPNLNPPIIPAGYNSWAGGYNSWAGGYNSWAGGYNSWAGGYNSWAGSYSSWAGNANWNENYRVTAEEPLCQTCVYVPLTQR